MEAPEYIYAALRFSLRGINKALIYFPVCSRSNALAFACNSSIPAGLHLPQGLANNVSVHIYKIASAVQGKARNIGLVISFIIIAVTSSLLYDALAATNTVNVFSAVINAY